MKVINGETYYSCREASLKSDYSVTRIRTAVTNGEVPFVDIRSFGLSSGVSGQVNYLTEKTVRGLDEYLRKRTCKVCNGPLTGHGNKRYCKTCNLEREVLQVAKKFKAKKNKRGYNYSEEFYERYKSIMNCPEAVGRLAKLFDLTLLVEHFRLSQKGKMYIGLKN